MMDRFKTLLNLALPLLLLLPLLMSGAALLTTAGKDHLCALSVCPLLFLPRWRAIK